MTATGSTLKTGYKYQLIFDKAINYCNEIKDLFDTIKNTLNSKYQVLEDDKQLCIEIEHDSILVSQEVNVVLLFLTAIYYDCHAVVYTDSNKQYKIHLIDGAIDYIESIND